MSVLTERIAAKREKHKLVEKGKEYLFKGINTVAFPYYFKAGGIVPSPNPLYPRDTWITNDVIRAEQFAGFGPLDGEQGCLVVINPEPVLTRGNLTPKRSLERAISPKLKEFYGQEIIKWDEILKVFTTEESYHRIRRDHTVLQPPDLPWEQFADKVELVQPGSKNHLNNALNNFLAK